jgi:hypothetical protein
MAQGPARLNAACHRPVSSRQFAPVPAADFTRALYREPPQFFAAKIVQTARKLADFGVKDVKTAFLTPLTTCLRYTSSDSDDT